MILYCATTNPGKLREFRQAAEAYGQGRVQVEVLPGLEGIPPCEETGRTFDDIVPRIQSIEWLSDEEKRKILEHNARRLFKL